MPQPIQQDASHIDLSPRIFTSTAVAGSPALAAETIVCTVTCANDLASTFGVILAGSIAFTVGTSGASARYRVRRTDTSGATVFDSGVTTAGITAAGLVLQPVTAVDAGGYVNGRIYVLTLTVGSGAAVSTVSAANLTAIVV